VSVSEVAAEPWFDKVSLLKLDIEGGEYPIAPSLGRAIRQRTPAFLLSTHIDYLNDVAAGAPALVRKTRKALRLLRHAALVWDFRAYPYWHVPSGSWWTPVSRSRAARLLLGYRNQEFLLTGTPLPG